VCGACRHSVSNVCPNGDAGAYRDRHSVQFADGNGNGIGQRVRVGLAFRFANCRRHPYTNGCL
jgi:hypothetical protein